MTVRSLWIGSELSDMERLSIRSFLEHGIDFDLYVYDTPSGLPKSTGGDNSDPAFLTLHSAETILPRSRIFSLNNYSAGFSDLFRWHLLAQKGGWWVDLDAVCLRPWDFKRDYVIASEQINAIPEFRPTSGIFKAPPNSSAIQWMVEECERKCLDIAKAGWCDFGPAVAADAVKRFSLESSVEPFVTFCPVPWFEWHKLIEPNSTDLNSILFDLSLSLHLWQSRWVFTGTDKNGIYPGSLYQALKERYL